MIKVEFEGFVNEVLPYDWGIVYRVTHNQVRKNHQGEWETTGRDYLSVVVPADSTTVKDTFAKDDRVEVTGKMKTKLYDKKDGSGKGISLEVRADTMVKVERNANVNPVMQQTVNKMTATVPQMQEIWPDVKQIPDDSVPF
jgi:single-stranded DNA-binding protein